MEHVPYDQLLIWQKGMKLATKAYFLTKPFPKEEMYGLTSQIRRAASSIPANIAEGSKRSTKKDFAYFIHIARGSLAELETHLHLAERVGITERISINPLLSESIELSKMLRSFQEKLF